MLLAFFGSRQSFLSESGMLYCLFHKFKSSSEKSLLIISLIFIVLAIVFCSFELASIRNEQGVIGFYFLLSVLFGMVGASGISAYVFLRYD